MLLKFGVKLSHLSPVVAGVYVALPVLAEPTVICHFVQPGAQPVFGSATQLGVPE